MNANFLRYEDISELNDPALFNLLNIPLGHAVSIPLPTLRWGRPGFAYFASPTFRVPGAPKDQAAPDRWWVIDAEKRSIEIYAKWEALPFVQGVNFETVHITPGQYTKSDIQEKRKLVYQLMDEAVQDFFLNQPGDRRICHQLLEGLTIITPAPLLVQYRDLAPDFFLWLEA